MDWTKVPATWMAIEAQSRMLGYTCQTSWCTVKSTVTYEHIFQQGKQTYNDCLT